MSVYTTEVRFICENAIPLKEQGDYTDINTAIEAGRKNIFTFDYDLFDPAYKPVIETKFLRHFYVREIGFETVALWKLRLEDKWKMKLPFYNKLWSSELIKFNPMYDVDYTILNTGDRYSNRNDVTETESNRHDSASGSTDSSSTTEDSGEYSRDENLLNKFSDTPQGGLNGVINSDWLTNATQNDNEISGDESSTSETTANSETSNTLDSTMNGVSTLEGQIHDIDDYQKHVIGKMGTRSYANLLMDFRKSFLNIDEMFINEMNDLFMLIY